MPTRNRAGEVGPRDSVFRPQIFFGINHCTIKSKCSLITIEHLFPLDPESEPNTRVSIILVEYTSIRQYLNSQFCLYSTEVCNIFNINSYVHMICTSYDLIKNNI